MTKKIDEAIKGRPDVMSGPTLEHKLPCSNKAKMYLTLNISDDYSEIFSWVKHSNCHKAFLEGLARLTNLAYKKGATSEEIVKALSDIKCGTTKELVSCPEFIGLSIKEVIKKEVK